MKKGWSLRRRLAAGLALGITVMWLVATLAAGLIARSEFNEDFDSALQETARRLLPLAVTSLGNFEGSAPANRVTPKTRHNAYLAYVIRNRSGKILLRSHDAGRDIFPTPPSNGFTNTATHRIYTEAATDGRIVIEIAEPLAHRREASLEAAMGIFAPLLLLIPLSLAGVWWFVRHSMQPVLDLTEQIEARGRGNLAPVAEGRLPSEITSIAVSINLLLIRLRQALEAERTFTANSAHELRTPIAATLAQTQRLIAETREGPLRDRGRQIERSLQHLARLSEKLMQLARAEGGGLLAETPEDLGPVLSFVIDEFRHNGYEIQVVESDSDDLWSRLDPDAFAILMRNLIENAFRHGRSDIPVQVVRETGGVVRVSNGSPVVSRETLNRLKGRFVRGVSDADGSGLGLAIAEMIASGAGVHLDLMSPATGRADGFEVILRFPPSAGMDPAERRRPGHGGYE